MQLNRCHIHYAGTVRLEVDRLGQVLRDFLATDGKMRILLKMMMEAFLWKEWWLRGWVLRRNSFRSMAQARN